MNVHEEVVSRLEVGDHDAATTLVLQQIGPAVLHYLYSRIRDDDLVAESFSRFSEDLWRGMPGFRRQVNVRIWAFAIARNSANQVLRKLRRDLERRQDFTSSVANAVAMKVRTTTVQYLKTDMKSRLEELRQRLSEDEQDMLFLRINQRLDWNDIARIQLSEGTGLLEEATLRRESARLRKQFQLAREKLRALAEKEGLIPTDLAD